MRIAHVSDCYLPRMGGIERQVQGLAAVQLAAGHEVEVITSVPAAATPTPAGLTVIRPSGPGSHPGSIRYLASLRGRQAVLRGDYDLVHVHASTFSPLAYLAAGAASRSGMATVATLHSLWSYATPIFRSADAALGWRGWPITWSAVSTAAADSLSQVLRPGTEISVLANGVSPERWQLPRRPRDPRRVVIVSVMRLAARKRPLRLLKVLREVRARVPAAISVEVQIIGDGPQREVIVDYLRRHRMTSWVELTGQLDQPAICGRFADADLYVSPATLESFGIAALEARCAGLPVLAFAGTGVADFIEHGRNGLLVRSDNQLAAALARLACSPAARAELAGHDPAGHDPAGHDPAGHDPAGRGAAGHDAAGHDPAGHGPARARRGSEYDYTWDQVLLTCEQVYLRAFEQAGRPAPPVPLPMAALTPKLSF